MNILVRGNLYYVSISANELSQNTFSITLPDGYSVETITISDLSNVSVLENIITLSSKQTYTFPAVDGKSPCKLDLRVGDRTKTANFSFIIEKFGKIPDIHYFDNAFKPILVTGKDGNEYNMIPSEQFK